MVMVKFKSSEGDIFELDEKAATLSLKIKEMLETHKGNINILNEIPIRVDGTPSAAMEIFIKWANYHKDDDEPDALKDRKFVKATKLPFEIELWDLKLMDVKMELVKAVNFLASHLRIEKLNNLTYHMIHGTFKEKYKELKMEKHSINMFKNKDK